MRRKIATISLICLCFMTALSAITLEVPEQIVQGVNVPVSVVDLPKGEKIAGIRLYIRQEGVESPLYLELKEEKGAWTGTIPGTYVANGELVSFIEYQKADGMVVRYPDGEDLRYPIISDTEPPVLQLVTPAEPFLERKLDQIILIGVTESSSLDAVSAAMNGEALDSVENLGTYIKILLNPQNADSLELAIAATDIAGNEGTLNLNFSMVGEPKKPFFGADGSIEAGVDLSYTLESTVDSLVLSPLDLDPVFAGIEHLIEAGAYVKSSGSVNAGPLVLSGTLAIEDSRTVDEYLEAYPSTLLSDYRDVMRLWNPYAFDNEFGFTTADVREYANGNTFLVELSLFDTLFDYKFGDQDISFQDQTVKSLGFRGHSVSMDLFLLKLSVAKGLTQLGLAGATWPQNFVGLQVGLDFFDYFQLQTNLSLISDFQGQFEELMDSGSTVPTISELYGLADVSPVENMVIGVGTGFKFGSFELSGELGVTLYVDDASTLLPITDISYIADYADLLTTINGYFPVFDYFPVSNGILSGAVDRDLWGITYAATLKMPFIGVEGWYKKADAAYKSLGASVTSDIYSFGGSWSGNVAKWALSASYERKMDNVPDILTNEIAPFIPVLGDYLTAGTPTEADISNISHIGILGVNTPAFGLLGKVSTKYTFDWTYTNAEALDADFADSTENNAAITNTITASWKSGKLSLGGFQMGLGAKTTDSYVIQQIVEGQANSDTYFEFSYDASLDMKLSKFQLSLAYGQEWGTAADVEPETSYGAGFKVSDIVVFDTLGISGEMTDTSSAAGALLERAWKTALSLDKQLGILSMSLALGVDYTDVQDVAEDDPFSLKMVVAGGVSL